MGEAVHKMKQMMGKYNKIKQRSKTVGEAVHTIKQNDDENIQKKQRSEKEGEAVHNSKSAFLKCHNFIVYVAHVQQGPLHSKCNMSCVGLEQQHARAQPSSLSCCH